MAVGAIAAVGLQVLGTASALSAERQAARRQIAQLNLQADEEQRIFRENMQTLLLEGEQAKAAQTAAFAKAGVEISAGAPMSVLEQTASSISQQMSRMQRDAAFRLNQQRFQQEEIRRGVKERRQASILSLGASAGKTAFGLSQVGKT